MPLGALDIIIAADTAQLRKGMDTAVDIMQSSTQKMESLAKTAGASIAGYFALSNLRDSVQQSLDLADSLGKMSQKIGMSVDDLYSLQAAGRLSDVALQEIGKSVLKLNKNLGEISMGGGKDAENALKNLGISSKEASGHIKDSNAILLEVADRFKDMPNGVAKSTIAMQLFGKSGADMIPLLNGGSESIKEFNGHMDKTTTDAAERFNDSFTRVGLSIDGAKVKLLTSMVPSIDTLSGRIENLSEWINDNSSEIEVFADRAMNDFTALSQVGVNAFHLIGETSTDMVNIVSSSFNFMASEVLGTDNSMVQNFGFFEYFILGLSTATSGIGQFVAHAKMAYATVAEYHAKYGSVTGLITNGGYDAAKARMDYHAASLEAQKYDKKVFDTYDTLIGLKKDFKAKSKEDEGGNNALDLRQYLDEQTKREAHLKAVRDKAEKDAKELKVLEQKLFDERINDGIKNFEEENKIKKGYLEAYAEIEAQNAIKTYELNLSLSDKTKQLTMTNYDYKSFELKKQYDEYSKVTSDKLLLDQWYNAEKNKLEKDSWAENNKFWADTFVNINKAMEDQFFNTMSGKFTSFGNWLKDFWSSITQSMSRGLSKSIADSIMGTNDSGGGIQNIFKSFGGLGSVFGSAATPAALIGATTDSAGFTTTAGGTVYDAAGQVTKQGSDYSDVLNAINVASSAKTIYGALTGEISASIASGFGQAGAYLGELTGSASLAEGVGSFGMGLSSPWASAGAGGIEGAGAMLGGAALGAAGGYVLGSVGDKLLGADTKAGTYGAIGGTIGAVVGGPVGAVIGAALGSLVGGMFGSTKVKGSGYYFGSSTEDGSNAQTYVDYKKKSWFSSSSWTTYSPLSEVEKSKIKGLFDTYDYLLVQLGTSKEITLAAGRYAGTTFQDQLAKNFITAFTDVEQSSSTFSTIYSYWTDYAKSINQTISQAFATSIGTYVSSTRSFNEWKLGSGTVEQLKFTSEYLTKDLAALENQMGVSGITVENYLSKYDEAMKSSFTPETITSWKNLGDALIAATDANTKYTDSIKALTTYTKPSDMMLSRVGDATSITGKSDGTVNSAMLEVLQKMWKELQNQTTIAQLNRGMA